MPATIEDVRKLALALPGVEEGICFGTPAFYVRRKLMLRMWDDGEVLVVRYPLEQREALMDAHPDVFWVTDHYRKHPAVLLNLLAVKRNLLNQMVEGAWRMQALPKQVAKWDQEHHQVARTPQQKGKRSETRP